jgi:hypothetical protein
MGGGVYGTPGGGQLLAAGEIVYSREIVEQPEFRAGGGGTYSPARVGQFGDVHDGFPPLERPHSKPGSVLHLCSRVSYFAFSFSLRDILREKQRAAVAPDF